MIAQFFLGQQITGKDTALQRLNAQIAELTEILSLERASKRGLEDNVSSLSASLTSAQSEQNRLRGVADENAASANSSGSQIMALTTDLDKEKQLSGRALSQVELLNQQISALRRQIAALEEALDVTEKRDRESQTKLADLGSRLNVALAQRVQELSRYRSDFFGRLRTILATRPDIRVVGDRFVFQSEVLFDSGKAEVNEQGRAELDKLASALLQLEKEIPSEINWVLRVDGHTDSRPIRSSAFPSNWELSAARAIAVVQQLIARGVSPQRLVAAGFGEFQPIEAGDSEEALRRNRRLELKLTER
jgi:chemotaxis protein MotB